MTDETSGFDLFGGPVRSGAEGHQSETDPGLSDRVHPQEDAGERRTAHAPAQPLAARIRPRSLDEFRGQEKLLGPGKNLRSMVDQGRITSLILWGPPGSGKTTLARLIASRVDATFVSVSAVTAGVAKIREIAATAHERRRGGRGTILFCDEIHRFNKAQQDAFLPHVEEGTFVLIGATTENPSFEVVRPLLSRAPVFVLEPLTPVHLEEILNAALTDPRGLASMGVAAEPAAIQTMAHAADGDARRALGILEAASSLADAGTITEQVAREAIQHRFAVYDKSGEEHFNLISALHKSIRGSDPDGALYWLARMLEGGEEPLYLVRRLVRMASEDIGLADPNALEVALVAQQTYHFLGSPEGELALAQAAVYLALAPKSNSIYKGFAAAREEARSSGALPVPLHLRNAPTSLMGDLGYGEGYRYDHDEPDGVAIQGYLPEELGARRFYEPTERGLESEMGRRLRWYLERRDPSANPPEGT